MSTPIKQIALITIVMLLLDGVYLSLLNTFFRQQIKSVQNANLSFNVLGAVLCYILLVFGLYYFIIREKKSVIDAFLFGLCIYGVYETTNLAIFTKWQYSMVMIDSLWGACLFAMTTYLTYRLLD